MKHQRNFRRRGKWETGKDTAWKSIPGISLSLCTSLLTISASVGIGITLNPERSWAGSTCAGVYSSRSGSPSLIGYYNSISKSYVNVATYSGSSNINAIATQPSTGNLFFVDRNTGKTIVYNPNTGSQSTLTGSISNPTTIIGATFNPSGKLYVYYNNKTLIEVDPATGSQAGSTITISGIPGNNDASPRITNGDIAIGTDGVLYAVGDTSSSGGSYTSQLYSIAISGTTATATPVNGNNNISNVSGAAVNGLAIDPSTNKFYISTNNGTYELNFATKAGTLLTSATGTNDLAACGSPTPDLPTINKSFSPDTVTNIPATSTLTLTLGNTNLVPIYLIQALTDNFQAGLKVSTPNGLSGTCTTIAGNTVTATAGSTFLSLNDGFKIPAGGCTVSVNVTANSAGSYTNTIAAGALKTFVGDNANAASSTLVVATITTSTISGTLYEDTNPQDDTFNNGEPTLPANVAVTLYQDTNNNNVINTGEQIATTTTNASGQYTFSNVTNGNYKIKVDTTDTDIPAGYTLGTPNDTAITVSGANLSNINFGFNQPVASNPNVLLVKRISAINGSSFTNLIDGVKDANSPYYVPEPHDTDDNNANWPSNYLQGQLNGGIVRPNDEIEYTIYFLSAGDTTANKVLICDRVPENATFIPTAFNNFPTKNTTGLPGSDRGIIWQNNGAIESLTNVSDGDTAEYLSPGIDPTIKYPGIKCDGSNTNGVVVVKLGNAPNATAPGTPINSYGFIRFRGRVK
jgi:hypothetical protein